ncbi:MAG: CBS domain-containing protein [Desulfobacterales bacterium]|nr:CBS domain-containing protein [Desulfobacterales bacterium]
MKNFFVKDLMVPLSEYATAPEDATLYEAVEALENAQKAFDDSKYRHRAILVLDKDGKVVGKIAQIDVLEALEPKYQEMISRQNGLASYGFSKKFMKDMLSTYRLWDSPLKDICKKAADIKVSAFMYTPTEGEFVEEEATLDEAIHQLVLGRHQSLLVTRDDEIIGILRLTDVFEAIFRMTKECALD